MIHYLYLGLFFFAPFVLNFNNSEFFEVPKMYFVYTVALLITATHLINYFQGRAPLFRRTQLTVPLLLFLAAQIISTLISIDPNVSFFGYYSRLNGGLLSLICYSLLYFILTIYIDDRLKSQLISISLISCLLVSGYGILEHFGIDRHFWVQDVQSRVFSTLGQPNWLAAYLGILLPLALDRLLSANGFISKSGYWLLVTSFYLCLLFTRSKSGILAAIITLGIFFVIKFIQKSNYFILVTASLLLVTLSLTISNPIKDILVSRFIPNTKYVILDTSLNITPSEDIRKLVWQGSLDLWRQFPVFGTGPETFAHTYYWTRPAAHNLTSEWNFIYNKAHNEYLNYLATTGTFGFISYLILVFSILYLIRNTIYLIPFLSILITNFFGFSVVVTSLYFFLLPAFIVSPIVNPATKPKSKITTFIFLLFIIYLLSKILFFYLADICYQSATKYDSVGKYSLALDQIKLSLFYSPNQSLYYTKKADILAKLTMADPQYAPEAILASDRAIQLSPFNLNSWKERAQTFYYLSTADPKNYLTALDALTKATRLAPTDAASFYLLGRFYDTIGQTSPAIENYSTAITLKPNYDFATFALGQLYFKQKDYSTAKPLFEQTLRLAPANLDAQDYLNRIATASSSKQ